MPRSLRLAALCALVAVAGCDLTGGAGAPGVDGAGPTDRPAASAGPVTPTLSSTPAGSTPTSSTPTSPTGSASGPRATGSTGTGSTGTGSTGTAPARALLFARSGGDGDSWKDTAGVEYRLGLVNTPELNECYGSTASAARKRLTRAGFTAQAYATDTYGRRVSVVALADGRNLNVLLARQGYADDRYLEQFRGENPSLARQLEPAFAAARRERLGLWGACRTTSTVPQGIAGPAPTTPPTAPPRTQSPATQPPARSGCDAAYPTVCIPSPSATQPDLDCPDISSRRFVVRAPDPHRFDSDGDGVGCESG